MCFCLVLDSNPVSNSSMFPEILSFPSYMMTSVDYKYQNALREAIVFINFSFVKNRSCTKILAKCILVVVVK